MRLPTPCLTLALAAALFATGCDGDAPPEDGGTDSGERLSPDTGLGPPCLAVDCGSCRADADCTRMPPFGGGVFSCYPPGLFAPGGPAPPEPTRECESPNECTAPQVCGTYPTPGNPSQPSTRCQDACDATSCGADERCAADGICEPIPCDEGFTCPTHTACDRTAGGHGCVRDTCTDDADCSGGFCVEARCYGGLGRCQSPAP